MRGKFKLKYKELIGFSHTREEVFETGPYTPDKAMTVKKNLEFMGAYDVRLIPYQENA